MPASHPQRRFERLPLIITFTLIGAMLLHGPIAQLAHYHAFSDQRILLGLAHGADVFSNLGFALVGVVGLLFVPQMRRQFGFAASWPAWCLFFVALLLTALGSAYYHLAPDDSRLVWDRIPIVLACAALLVAVRAECRPRMHVARWLLALGCGAILSVWWWHLTQLNGQGDLRPYLLLQVLPLLLIPVWQTIYQSPAAERISFGLAIALYAAAKAAELHDHELLAAWGWISGHTLKHLLATAAAAVITGTVAWRVRIAGSPHAARVFMAT